MKLLSIIILLTILTHTNTLYTFYQQFTQNTSYYKCLKPTSNDRIILRYIYSFNETNQTFIQNINNALEAGMNVELVIAPTRCRSVGEELDFLVKSLEGKNIEKFWICVDDVPGD